ncbi:helix-turn-helix domain-containing protein [Paenibacillus contaminans]|uniref:AraC family transcriptional regulator n=1 Tax=Paenibacillus contaminans TaxID=450362 RepID=A0A329MGK9_9BACL|nr:helix-turn-helix domain-containing protein [Paenibacillus contaminans]RAV18974.1 AraC family transcriptional regulator [Paenibacillus contaminans]
MNKTWFYRTLLSYVPVFFVVTAFLFFIFFQTLSEQNKKNAVKANDVLARQAMQSIDHSLKSIDQKLTYEAMNNQDMVRYFAQDGEEDLYLNVRLMNAIQEFIVNNPLVDSMYLVRFKDRSVLSLGTSYPLDQYPDAGFIKQREHAPNSLWSDVRSYREFSFEVDKRVVTLTRGVPIFTQDKGMIIANVRTDALHGLVKDMYDPGVSFMQMTDSRGASLLEQGDSPKTPESKRNELFASYTSDYTEWNVQTGVPSGGLASFVLGLYNVWFTIGLIMVAGGIGWMIYVTKRNYKPIELIVGRLRTYSEQKAQSLSGDGNEFHFIQNALERLIEETGQFAEQFEQDLRVKRQFFFYELLEGTRPIGLDEWQKEMERHKLPVTFGDQLAFVIEIDKYGEFCRTYSQRDQHLLKFVIDCVVQESTQNGPLAVWKLWTAGDRLSGIFHSIGGERELREESLSLLEKVRAWVEQNLQMTVTIGVGERVELPDELRVSGKEALEALNFKTVYGINRIIMYKDTVPSKGEMYEHLQLIQTIVHHYRFSDEAWLACLREFFGHIRRDLLSRDDTSSLMSFFIFHLNRAIAGMGPELQEPWQDKSLPGLYDALESFETIDELEQLFMKELGEYADTLRSLRDARSQHALMGDVKAYIEKQFTDPNLSLDLLSERFDLNGKYLSKLFKETFGVKFVDFLIELRMEHAKRLLKETNVPVQEIAEQVGYASSVSFIRIFKKSTGLSPGDYRKEDKK